MVTSVFVTIALLLVGTSYVSGGARPETAVAQAAGAQEQHIEYYRQHLARLGIERLNCM